MTNLCLVTGGIRPQIQLDDSHAFDESLLDGLTAAVAAELVPC